ncbi:hypothetical protein [Bacillus sp. JJ722]|uniref:hypothetical protein n=1 Tax=Bacillus sp. JJ722 TaxID=3122973 RepID=UPI003000A0B9
MNEDPNTQSQKPIIKYRDINDITYSNEVLQFLRSKLDDFTIDCFREVVKHHKNGGLTKTSLNVYTNQRKKHEAAFLILESQGFIEVKMDGLKKPYFLTPRGLQLVNYLQKEARNKATNQI